MEEVPSGKLINSVGQVTPWFLASFIENKSYKDILRFSVCAGSASAYSEDLCTKDEVLRLL